MVGSSAIICMPTDAPALKVEATRRYGAEIVFYDRMKDDRAALAARIASETGRVLVPPYDDYAIMAGRGRRRSSSSRTSRARRARDPGGRRRAHGGLRDGGEEPRPVHRGDRRRGRHRERHLPLAPEGERVTIPPPPTIADGIRVTSPGALTFPILRERLTGVSLVTDAEIVDAVRLLALRVRVVVEPTGAVGAAACSAGSFRSPGRARRRGALGGNIDPNFLAQILKPD